jgi:hypothetical protein
MDPNPDPHIWIRIRRKRIRILSPVDKIIQLDKNVGSFLSQVITFLDKIENRRGMQEAKEEG